MPTFGDITLDYVSELSKDNFSKTAKVIDYVGRTPLNKNIKTSANKFSMTGVAIKNGNKSKENYVNDLIAIGDRNEAYNFINFDDVKGFANITGINSTNTADKMNMREYAASGEFFPANSYMREYRINTDYVDNDFAISFSPFIVCPVDSYNFIVKTPWSTLPVSMYASVYGNEGTIPIIKPFEIFNGENYSTLTGVVGSLEEAEGGTTLNLDADGEYSEWSFTVGNDVPLGVYNLICRVRDDNVASDITITVTSNTVAILTETFSTGSSAFTTIQTSDFQLLTEDYDVVVKIEKETAGANVIEVDYAFLNPNFSAYVLFDCDSEVDKSEVKIYDTLGYSDEADWVKVHNSNHNFVETSDLIIQNSLYRWTLDLSAIWENTGEFKNLYTEDVGYLYNYAYKYDSIKWYIKEIRPDYVEILFHFTDVSSDSAAADCSQTCTLIVDPIRFKFAVGKNGATKHDWYLDYEDNSNYLGVYYPDSHFVSRADAAVTTYSANGSSVGILDSSAVIIGKSTDGNMVYDADGIYFCDGTTASSEDYTFVLSAINKFEGFEFLYVAGEDLSTTPITEPITHSDFASADGVFNSAIYKLAAGTAGHWTWVTDHLACAVANGVYEAQILRSYQYHTAYNLDVTTYPLAPTVDNYAYSGIIFAYKDVNNYLYARINRQSAATPVYKVELYRLLLGVPVLISSIVYATTGTYQTLEVDVSGTTVELFAYVKGGSKPSAQISETLADVLDGFVGVYSYTTDAAGATISFNDFATSGYELHAPRGIKQNGIVDDLTWNSLTEYEHDNGDNTYWTADDDLCITTKGDDVFITDAMLTNLEFSAGKLKGLTKINSTVAVDRYSGFTCCSHSTQKGYAVAIELDDTDNCYLKLLKFDIDAVAGGTYGYGGYGVIGYGGIAVIITLAFEDLTTTYEVGDWVWLECEFAERSLQCYIYPYGSSKPVTPNVTYYEDADYEYGRIGLYAYADKTEPASYTIDVSYRNLEIIDTTEYNSGSSSFISMGGVNHGSVFDGGEFIRLFGNEFGTDIQLGVYLLNAGYINTDKDTGNAAMTARFENTDDSTGLDIVDASKTEDIASSVTWGTYSNTLKIGDNDDGDNGIIEIKRKSDADYDERLSVVSFMGLIPISNAVEGSSIFASDLVFEAFNDHSIERILERREIGGFLIKRFDGSFGEL